MKSDSSSVPLVSRHTQDVCPPNTVYAVRIAGDGVTFSALRRGR